MKGVPAILFYSCQKAGQLIEQSFQEKLSRLTRFRLLMHTFICFACREYEKQSLVVEKAIQRRMKDKNWSVSTEDLERLRKKVNAKI